MMPHPLDHGEHQLTHRVADLRAALRTRDPNRLAALTEARPADGAILLPFFEREVRVDVPGFIVREADGGEELPMHVQAMVLFYLATGDGAPLRDRWVSFADLPDGRIYNQAYQGYTGALLARRFGDDLETFARAAQAAGGREWPFADRAYRFLALPRVPLLVAAWRGDEDFPSSYRVLFDASAPHYLPTDVCAVLGGMLTRRLVKSSSSGARRL